MKPGTTNHRPFLLAALVVLGTAASAAVQTRHQEFSLSKEKELEVILDISFGNVTLERCDGNSAATVDYSEDDRDHQRYSVSYDVSGETGTLRIKLKEPSHFWEGGEHAGHKHHLDIGISANIPVSFDIELGAGKGDFDLTDLQVKDFKISTGASSVNMECGQPNPIAAEDVSIESGVSKFSASGLGNLNFHHLKFSGGVGSYKLDFDGKFHQSASAEIEVGLGSITVYVPKTLPTRLSYDDNWLSSFSLDDDFDKKSNSEYETEDFREASKRFTIRLDSGLGSVKVYRK